MNWESIGRGAVRATKSIFDYIVLAALVFLAIFVVYALWDDAQLHQVAESSRYAVYKPTAEEEGRSFQELQALNAEVFAWLTVYGTHIDYPVTQGDDNMKYVNTNAEGQYSLSGAIFLDYRNSPDFSDFNHVLYGHHMARSAMFGEIGSFSDKDIFDSHRYGYLYFDGQERGIEFFAFIHTRIRDYSVFDANITGDEERQAVLDDLLGKALHTRDIGVTIDDRIILLTTCSSSSTNGRDVLVGRITGEVYDDPFIALETDDGRDLVGVDSRSSLLWGLARGQLILILVLLFILLLTIFIAIVIRYKREQKREKRGREQ